MIVPRIVLGNHSAEYEVWKILSSYNGNNAVAKRKVNGRVIEVALRKLSLSIPLEGWYGDEPSSARYAIGGICILCECYGLTLHGLDVRTTAPPFLSPCNHHEFQKIERLLDNGHCVTWVHMPTELCIYHTTLVPIQAEVAKRKGVVEMVYHVPRKEYHVYLNTLERMIGMELPGLHRLLDRYTDRLEHFVRETFRKAGVNVRIVDPLFPGMDPNDAYRALYLNPSSFDMDPQSLIGIEDLVEVRIVVEAEQKGAHRIPVWAGVLGIPSPYRQRGVAQTKRFSLDELRK